jgi:hypothetical protein
MNREYYLNALICLLLLRVVILGATLPDSIALAAFAIYLSFSQYVNIKRWKNDSDDINKKIDELISIVDENKKYLTNETHDLRQVVQIISAKVDQVKLGVSFSQGNRK